MGTLTPQAKAIAAFTLAVLLGMGHLNRITFQLILVFGTSFPASLVGMFGATTG